MPTIKPEYLVYTEAQSHEPCSSCGNPNVIDRGIYGMHPTCARCKRRTWDPPPPHKVRLSPKQWEESDQFLNISDRTHFFVVKTDVDSKFLGCMPTANKLFRYRPIKDADFVIQLDEKLELAADRILYHAEYKASVTGETQFHRASEVLLWDFTVSKVEQEGYTFFIWNFCADGRKPTLYRNSKTSKPQQSMACQEIDQA